MISFNVKALFASLPMKKALDILEKKLKSFFLQEDGALMGGTLSCLLLDLFMEDYESKINFQIGSSTITGDWL